MSSTSKPKRFVICSFISMKTFLSQFTLEWNCMGYINAL
uniref:Uncharacterized protein n=1 Tax=Anguilla anguilla TaxID=7936 RepID=A0A0E9VE35_ANGAN